MERNTLYHYTSLEDIATHLLMAHFYKNYFLGNSKHDSLKLAQKYVKEYKDEDGNLIFDNPRYWAAWILLDAIN